MSSLRDKPAVLTKKDRPNLSVAFVLLPEFTLSTFSAFVDVLRLAADTMDDSRQRLCQWTLLGADLAAVKSSCGIRITPDKPFDDPSLYDYVVVCGGLLKGHSTIAPAVYEYLQRADQTNCQLIGLCTGSFALAAAGLLHNHKACIHWVHAPEFIAKYPDIPIDSSRLYLTQGRYTTCAGGLASANLAINLVVKYGSKQQAHKVMTGHGVETFRSGRSPQQHKGADWFNRIDSQLVRRAILLMGSHINEAISAEDIRQSLNISASTLERAFKHTLGCSPASFARMLRLAYGRWELLHSTKPITDIANNFGFSDSSHFSQWYKRVLGTTPSQDREQMIATNGQAEPLVPRANKLSPVVQEMLAGELLLFDQGWLEQQIHALH